jgi:hypothetical protein
MALEEAIKESDNKAQETELIINQEKETKYMRISKKAIAIGGYRFESLIFLI